MSYRNRHKHYCASPGCNVVIATCSAPQDYDGSPNTCTDEEHYHYVLCEDCEHEREQERIADERENV